MKKLGIIAAKGGLSKELINFAKDKFEIFIVAIKNETSPELIKDFKHIWINLGEIGKVISTLKDEQIKTIVFVGSLKKPDIFNLKLDELGKKLLAKIIKDKFFGDNKILSSLTDFLTDSGFEVLGVHEIINNLVVQAKNFTSIIPNEQDEIDIVLAIKVVTELGKLDVGQGAIVQNGVVLGVEAVEGTDQLIKRCSKIKFSNSYGGVLVKLSKVNQELRMDLPTIGIDTIKNMHKSGFKGVVIEAKKAIFLNQEEAIKFADQNGMFIKSINLSR